MPAVATGSSSTGRMPTSASSRPSGSAQRRCCVMPAGGVVIVGLAAHDFTMVRIGETERSSLGTAPPSPLVITMSR